jgi:hypothetical protein
LPANQLYEDKREPFNHLRGFCFLSTSDLGDFLERSVYPALFDRLDRAFPEYRFRRKGNRWEASTADATRSLPGSPRPDRVNCYVNRPWGLVIQGGGFVRLLDLVNGGTKPSGPDFAAAVRKLADLAGIPMLEREVSTEDAERQAKRHARRSALETVAALTPRSRFTATAKASAPQ